MKKEELVYIRNRLIKILGEYYAVKRKIELARRINGHSAVDIAFKSPDEEVSGLARQIRNASAKLDKVCNID